MVGAAHVHERPDDTRGGQPVVINAKRMLPASPPSTESSDDELGGVAGRGEREVENMQGAEGAPSMEDPWSLPLVLTPRCLS